MIDLSAFGQASFEQRLVEPTLSIKALRREANKPVLTHRQNGIS
jgi:hypothetical protein